MYALSKLENLIGILVFFANSNVGKATNTHPFSQLSLSLMSPMALAQTRCLKNQNEIEKKKQREEPNISLLFNIKFRHPNDHFLSPLSPAGYLILTAPFKNDDVDHFLSCACGSSLRSRWWWSSLFLSLKRTPSRVPVFPPLARKWVSTLAARP